LRSSALDRWTAPTLGGAQRPGVQQHRGLQRHPRWRRGGRRRRDSARRRPETRMAVAGYQEAIPLRRRERTHGEVPANARLGARKDRRASVPVDRGIPRGEHIRRLRRLGDGRSGIVEPAERSSSLDW